MTRRGSFPTQFALTAMIVLLAAAVSSSAPANVFHLKLNGPFTDAFFSCNADGSVCAQLSLFFNAEPPGEPSQANIFYSLSLSNNGNPLFFQGFGTIPNENVTNIDSKTLTLALTDTSTIAGFTNIVCDMNGNCTNAPGGIVSGTWTQNNLSSSHSTFSNVTHSGAVLISDNGSSDSFSAIAQFSVLGNNFQGIIGDIGTQHSTQRTVQVP